MKQRSFLGSLMGVALAPLGWLWRKVVPVPEGQEWGDIVWMVAKRNVDHARRTLHPQLEWFAHVHHDAVALVVYHPEIHDLLGWAYFTFRELRNLSPEDLVVIIRGRTEDAINLLAYRMRETTNL